jgi:hypothetical protein
VPAVPAVSVRAPAPVGLVGFRFLLAVLLLVGLSAAPLLAVVAAGQAALEQSSPPVARDVAAPWTTVPEATVPEATAHPRPAAGSDGPGSVGRADPAVPAPC